MQKIIPHLWYDTQAKEAAEFYCSVFPNSKINSHNVIHNTPSGDCDIMNFEIMGFKFMSISAGPLFKLNPSISFMVNLDPKYLPEAETKIDEIWEKLTDGGKIMMPLQEYPFSKRYGWVEDKYGVSWQLMVTDPKGEDRPTIIPSIMFAGKKTGQAQEATDFYMSTFKNSKRGTLAMYPEGAAPDEETKVMYTDFTLEDQWFASMDGGHMHDFDFNEAVSLLVKCEDQTEIDYYWEKLSAVPQAEQCGWLKDKFGVSWQITPKAMDEIMSNGTPEQVQRVTEAFLKMKKFDVAELQKAYDGN